MQETVPNSEGARSASILPPASVIYVHNAIACRFTVPEVLIDRRESQLDEPRQAALNTLPNAHPIDRSELPLPDVSLKWTKLATQRQSRFSMRIRLTALSFRCPTRVPNGQTTPHRRADHAFPMRICELAP